MPQFLKNWRRIYRHRKILRTINIPTEGRVLDLSCGDGQFFRYVYEAGPGLEFSGIDINTGEIEQAKKDLPFARFSIGSAENLNFPEGSFDIIFSIMSLHHYKNAQKVFEEVGRVLKTGGVLYLVDLIPKYKWTQKLWNWKGCSEPYHFEKYYSIDELGVILKPLGLGIVSNKNIVLFPRTRILEIRKL